MKNRNNKGITTTVIAIMFALAITLPATSSKVEASKNIGQQIEEIFIHPLTIDIVCLAGLGIGAVALLTVSLPTGYFGPFGIMVTTTALKQTPLIALKLIGAIVTGAVAGCASFVATSLGLHYISKAYHEGVDSLLSSEKSAERYFILDEQGDIEDQVAVVIHPSSTLENKAK